MSDFTFLTVEQIFGENRLEIFKDRKNIKAEVTDFAQENNVLYSIDSLNQSNGYYWTKSIYNIPDMGIAVNEFGQDGNVYFKSEVIGARLVIPFLSLLDIPINDKFVINKTWNDFLEVEYGYYPQKSISRNLCMILDSEYHKNKLRETGNKYTDPINNKILYPEYELNGHRYIRVDRNHWIEVQPIKWLVDEKN